MDERGRHRLGSATHATRWPRIAGALSEPCSRDSDSADTGRPNIIWATKAPYMTAGTLRNALNWAGDDDRVEVVGTFLRIWNE